MRSCNDREILRTAQSYNLKWYFLWCSRWVFVNSLVTAWTGAEMERDKWKSSVFLRIWNFQILVWQKTKKGKHASKWKTHVRACRASRACRNHWFSWLNMQICGILSAFLLLSENFAYLPRFLLLVFHIYWKHLVQIRQSQISEKL